MIDKPTSLEKVSGSFATATLTTAVAAVVGGPLAAILPVLSGSLAAGRRKDRVNRALLELKAMIEENAEAIEGFSDSQFRVVSEIIEATLQTAQEEKLEYLRRAAQNIIEGAEITPHEAEWLARVIRDLSADELRFVIDSQDCAGIAFANEATNIPGIRAILDDDPELPAASGLISLGLLIPGKNTIGDIGTYRFNPLVARLLDLVRDAA